MTARSRAGAVAALVAALSYSTFLLERWTHPPFPADKAFISQLEVPGEPWSWLYRSSDVVAGAAMVLVALAVWRRLNDVDRPRVLVATVALAATGLCSMSDSVTTMACNVSAHAPCDVEKQSTHAVLAQLADLHADSGVVELVGAILAAIALSAVLIRRSPALGIVGTVLGSGIGVSGVLDVLFLLHGGDIGLAERARTLLTSAWLVSIAVLLLRPDAVRDHDGIRRRPPGTATDVTAVTMIADRRGT